MPMHHWDFVLQCVAKGACKWCSAGIAAQWWAIWVLSVLVSTPFPPSLSALEKHGRGIRGHKNHLLPPGRAEGLPFRVKPGCWLRLLLQPHFLSLRVKTRLVWLSGPQTGWHLNVELRSYGSIILPRSWNLCLALSFVDAGGKMIRWHDSDTSCC